LTQGLALRVTLERPVLLFPSLAAVMKLAAHVDTNVDNQHKGSQRQNSPKEPSQIEKKLMVYLRFFLSTILYYYAIHSVRGCFFDAMDVPMT
jgi:hypothetical protein